MTLHLVKLCVGCDTVEELVAWQNSVGVPGGPWILRTRQTPRLADQLIDGGSLYRVFKGAILCRQRILAVTCVEAEGQRRCEITLDPAPVLTVPTPRRAFQGWRYLGAADVPSDLGDDANGEALPPDLARRLREAGVW